jgi:hypothetical protein
MLHLHKRLPFPIRSSADSSLIQPRLNRHIFLILQWLHRKFNLDPQISSRIQNFAETRPGDVRDSPTPICHKHTLQSCQPEPSAGMTIAGYVQGTAKELRYRCE